MVSAIPKPFIKVGEKSILEHTIARFLEFSEVKQIIVATSKSYINEIENIVGHFVTDVHFDIVEGGKERQFSIYNALKHVGEEIDLVAVHDAVRPFVRVELIEECCRAAEKVGGAVLGVPAKDTIKRVDESLTIQETPNRSFLWQAQTPQVFQRQLLIDAYESAISDGYVGTDDASLVERISGKVQMVEGDRENLKITYPVDLKIAELIIGKGS